MQTLTQNFPETEKHRAAHFARRTAQTPMPLASNLGEMSADVAAYNLSEMQLIIAREWDCEFNWKVLVENFMESYHHLGIHSKTLQPMMPARNTWSEQERRNYVRAHLPYKGSAKPRESSSEAASGGLPLLPGLSEMQQTEWGLFLVPPTFLLATAPDCVIWYRLQPLAPDRLKLLTTLLVAPSFLEREDFESLREKAAEMATTFHLEDMEVCTAVQRGL